MKKHMKYNNIHFLATIIEVNKIMTVMTCQN